MGALGKNLRKRFSRKNLKGKGSQHHSPCPTLQSLGTGSLSENGSVNFSPSPRSTKPKGTFTGLRSLPSCKVAPPADLLKTPMEYFRRKTAFLRVADLGMSSTRTLSEESSEPHYHHPAVDPPPGFPEDPLEQWIALSDGDGSHCPIAPLAMDRLSNFGLITSMNDNMWSPDSKTERLLQQANQAWIPDTFKPGLTSGDKAEADDVLVWTGNFKHGLYGSDLPAIRAAGIVNMSARALMELLVDSSRVKEYNKLSLGRDDIINFEGNMNSGGPFGRSITKVMKSETKPPMIRKTLVFESVLHAKELVDGSGYVIVTRAVHNPEEAGATDIIKSEILIGVNIIRKIASETKDNRCLMINVNHIRSPMIPMMVARRLGVSAAIGFINDIRAAA